LIYTEVLSRRLMKTVWNIAEQRYGVISKPCTRNSLLLVRNVQKTSLVLQWQHLRNVMCSSMSTRVSLKTHVYLQSWQINQNVPTAGFWGWGYRNTEDEKRKRFLNTSCSSVWKWSFSYNAHLKISSLAFWRVSISLKLYISR
jgi:hypothetical protein